MICTQYYENRELIHSGPRHLTIWGGRELHIEGEARVKTGDPKKYTYMHICIYVKSKQLVLLEFKAQIVRRKKDKAKELEHHW